MILFEKRTVFMRKYENFLCFYIINEIRMNISWNWLFDCVIYDFAESFGDSWLFRLKWFFFGVKYDSNRGMNELLSFSIFLEAYLEFSDSFHSFSIAIIFPRKFLKFNCKFSREFSYSQLNSKLKAMHKKLSRIFRHG
jgi:hypothetical protein